MRAPHASHPPAPQTRTLTMYIRPNVYLHKKFIMQTELPLYVICYSVHTYTSLIQHIHSHKSSFPDFEAMIESQGKFLDSHTQQLAQYREVYLECSKIQSLSHELIELIWSHATHVPE